MAGVALTPLVLIGLYAWVTSRMTRYTITNRRVVLSIGVAMPITFNLPFARIDAANLRAWSAGHGDITLTLAPTERLAYLVLWPHVRPRRMARPQPSLRCIPDAAATAQILARALQDATTVPAPAVTHPEPATPRRKVAVLV